MALNVDSFSYRKDSRSERNRQLTRRPSRSRCSSSRSHNTWTLIKDWRRKSPIEFRETPLKKSKLDSNRPIALERASTLQAVIAHAIRKVAKNWCVVNFQTLPRKKAETLCHSGERPFRNLYGSKLLHGCGRRQAIDCLASISLCCSNHRRKLLKHPSMLNRNIISCAVVHRTQELRIERRRKLGGGRR